MDWIRRVVVNVKEPEDKDVLWIDSSDPGIHIIKIYDKGEWKPLIADRLVKQVPSYMTGYYVSGLDGSVDLAEGHSVATVSIEDAKRVWFLGVKTPSNELNSGYAFYDKRGNVIESYCWPNEVGLLQTTLTEIECDIPIGATTFRTTLFGDINEGNFYCNLGKTYSNNTISGVLAAKYNTTEYWNNAIGYVPLAGEVVVYSDYKTIVENGETKTIPGIKIGSGNAFIQDLKFVGEYEADMLLQHITNADIHVTPEQKEFWNNKINVNDYSEVINEALIFNRQ